MKIINKDDVVISNLSAASVLQERREKQVKKEVTVELLVDRAELHKNANILRVIGKIIEDSQRNIQQGVTIRLTSSQVTSIR